MSTAVYLYIAIILLATLFARLAMTVRFTAGKYQLSIKEKSSGELNILFVALSFLTLLLFIGLSTSGTDYSAYERWFRQSTSYSWREIFSMEWAYYILNRIVRIFSSDFRVFNFIYSVIFLLLIYSTLCYMSDKVHFAWAVFVFAALFYFPAFNIKRICLAVAIVFFASRFLIKKHYVRYLLAIIIASGVHTSAIFWLLFFISYLIINERVYEKHLFLVIIAYILLILLLIVTRDFWTNLNISERYYQYESSFNGIGLGIILKYAVLIFFIVRWLIILRRNGSDLLQDSTESYLWRIFVVATVVSMVFAFSGYVNQVFSRMQSYSMCSFVLFIPYLMYLWTNNNLLHSKFKNEIFASRILIFLYILYFFFDFVFTQMITSGLSIYTTLWGWSIGN